MAPAKPRDRSFAGQLTGEEAERHKCVLLVEAARKRPVRIHFPLADSAPPAAHPEASRCPLPGPHAIRVQVVAVADLID